MSGDGAIKHSLNLSSVEVVPSGCATARAVVLAAAS
mgnify:CR=1 FL=1